MYVPLMEFMYLVFTRVCQVGVTVGLSVVVFDVFRALINSSKYMCSLLFFHLVEV